MTQLGGPRRPNLTWILRLDGVSSLASEMSGVKSSYEVVPGWGGNGVCISKHGEQRL